MRSIKTITNQEIMSNPAWISAILLISAAAESTVTLNDSVDGTGTDRASIKVQANDSKLFNFSNDGIRFDTAVYSTITGTDAIAYIYFR